MRCVRSLAAPTTVARRRTPKERRARTIGRRLDRDEIIPRSSASAADRWDTRKLGVPNRISRFPFDRTDGIPSPRAHKVVLMDHSREMAYRPGTHPYRSARDSFGPQIISNVHIDKFFAIISPTCRKFCSVLGSGCNSINRHLFRTQKWVLGSLFITFIYVYLSI